MKLKKSCITIFIIMICLFSFGCKDNNLSQPSLERDRYNTGGNLTFVYDEVAHVASVGGEGEVIQFYDKDLVKGWDEEGNRIGFSLLVPKEVKDYKSGKANLNGEKLLADDYISLNEGQNLIATFQPIVKNGKEDITLKITWEDGKNEQIYKIIIAKGTLFMEKQNSVE